VLGSLQALALGPLKRLRRLWPLTDQQAIQPRQAWRWIGSSWIHANGLEAALNLLLLLILLGASPLPLAQVVLRYGLTALACLLPAALIAHRSGVRRRWSGASGPLSALIALAAGLSLLHWRAMTFATPLAAIPAWVLLLIYGALQLSWQLPRNPGDHHSTPWQRLLSSSWGWGLILGLSWAVISRVRELL
jgi:membrane associated rhomboid family serine protease